MYVYNMKNINFKKCKCKLKCKWKMFNNLNLAELLKLQN